MRFLTSNIEHRTPNDEIASLHFSKDDIFRFRTDANLQMDERPIIRKMHVVRNTIILAGICWLFGFSWIGCGVKGPPVPPRQPPVPAVSGLAYRVADRAVILTWSLPGPLSGRQAKRRRSASTGPEPSLKIQPARGAPWYLKKRNRSHTCKRTTTDIPPTCPWIPGIAMYSKSGWRRAVLWGPIQIQYNSTICPMPLQEVHSAHETDSFL
jgi:hypothetical protein